MSRFFQRLVAREQTTAPSVSEWRACVLQRHEAADFGGALVLASEQWSEGVEISARGKTGAKVVFPATPVKTSGKFGGVLGISVCMSLCETLGLAKDVKECEVRVLSEICAFHVDKVEIAILEGFVSKRDIWKFQLEVLGSAVYLNHAPAGQAAWRVTQVGGTAGGQWGVVGSKTEVVFDSLAAQLVVFLVLSVETWDFDSVEGIPFFERKLQYLEEALLADEEAGGSGHVVSIVVTARLAPSASCKRQLQLQASEDFYEVVYQGSRNSLNKTELFSHLRQFFFSFPGLIGWRPPDCRAPSYALRGPTSDAKHTASPYSLLADSKLCKLRMQHAYSGNFPSEATPVPAEQTNVLEAMNLGFDQFALVHVDRKLHTTNFRVAVVYAGNGSLTGVDAQLCELTRDRVGYHRPISVLVCLQPPPLFRVPRVELGAPSYTPVDASFLNLAFFGASDEHAHDCCPSPAPGLQQSSPPRFSPNPTPVARGGQAETAEHSLRKIPLQRVATKEDREPTAAQPAGGGAAGGGGGDFQVDTWTVQGERTFHELVGMRMAFEMQLLDDTEKTNFGTNVSRAALRGKDINEVQMRGMKTKWSLRQMEGGNISVSKTTYFRRHIFIEYNYYIRWMPYWRREDVGKKKTQSELAPVMTKCKFCENVNFHGFSKRRKSFHSPLSVLWNQLDHIVTDPTALVSSVIPLGAPRSELALSYRTRPAMKTNLFCLVPEGLDHKDVAVRGGGVGADPFSTSSAQNNGNLFERFLSFLMKFEQLTKIKLNVNLNRKPQTFNAMKVLVDEGRDWLTIHHDDAFVPPRLFVFSVEWLMCHAKFVQGLNDAFATAAGVAGFALVQLPHAQLFPPSASSSLWPDREVAFERLPLRPRFVFLFPDWVSKTPGNFFSRFLNRLTECMKMLFLFNCVTPANLETEEEKTGAKRSIYLRYPGWTLMTRDGSYFVILRPDKCELFENYVLTWSKRQQPALSALHADYFIELRSFLHNTLVECEPSF